MGGFLEACYLVYDINSSAIKVASRNLSSILSTAQDSAMVMKCKDKRIERIRLMNEAIQRTVRTIPSAGYFIY